MPAFETTQPPAPPSLTPYDRDAIFAEDGPFHPLFMHEAVRTLMRALPLDPDEPEGWRDRRQVSTMMGLAALHPRDEIEIMLGVQSLCAYHAAAICWHLGMNQARPAADCATSPPPPPPAPSTPCCARWNAARPSRCPSPS